MLVMSVIKDDKEHFARLFVCEHCELREKLSFIEIIWERNQGEKKTICCADYTYVGDCVCAGSIRSYQMVSDSGGGRRAGERDYRHYRNG